MTLWACRGGGSPAHPPVERCLWPRRCPAKPRAPLPEPSTRLWLSLQFPSVVVNRLALQPQASEAGEARNSPERTKGGSEGRGGNRGFLVTLAGEHERSRNFAPLEKAERNHLMRFCSAWDARALDCGKISRRCFPSARGSPSTQPYPIAIRAIPELPLSRCGVQVVFKIGLQSVCEHCLTLPKGVIPNPVSEARCHQRPSRGEGPCVGGGIESNTGKPPGPSGLLAC